MRIKGIEGMSVFDIQDEVNKGGKFVIYTYCVSVIIMTFKRPTDVYFIRSDQRRVSKGLPYTLVSLLFGWWGIPWGIIYTIGTIGSNFGGGKDVTAEIMNFVHRQTAGPVFDFEKEIDPAEENKLKDLANQKN